MKPKIQKIVIKQTNQKRRGEVRERGRDSNEKEFTADMLNNMGAWILKTYWIEEAKSKNSTQGVIPLYKVLEEAKIFCGYTPRIVVVFKEKSLHGRDIK